jgi:hypothetical protein
MARYVIRDAGGREIRADEVRVRRVSGGAVREVRGSNNHRKLLRSSVLGDVNKWN